VISNNFLILDFELLTKLTDFAKKNFFLSEFSFNFEFCDCILYELLKKINNRNKNVETKTTLKNNATPKKGKAFEEKSIPSFAKKLDLLYVLFVLVFIFYGGVFLEMASIPQIRLLFKFSTIFGT